jgi:hypothetical protein
MAFPTNGRQALEKAILEFYLAELDKMSQEFEAWQSATGIVPQPGPTRFNKLLQGDFKDNVNALITYTQETDPDRDIAGMMAARAVGCYGFWSFSNQVLGLPPPRRRNGIA